MVRGSINYQRLVTSLSVVVEMIQASSNADYLRCSKDPGFLVKACILLVTIDAPSAEGRRNKKKSTYDAYDYDADDFYIEETPHMLPTPHIDFHGSLRRGFAMQVGLIDPHKNAVCSPISALLPLGKLALGAKGKTRKELLNALGYSFEQLKPGMRKLIDSMRYIEGITLDVVSKIYVSKTASVHPSFEEHTMEIFGSSIEKVNFGNRQYLVDFINEFVARETRNMIQKLLSPQDVAPGASLILVNAIYFQGNWRKHFDKAVPSTFYTADGSRTVPMMEVIDRFKYVKAESISAEIIEIPYLNSNASFVVVLPDERNGLPMLLTSLKLAPAMLNDAMKGMKDVSVKVLLPKFKASTKLNLKDLYKKVGVTRIFHENHRDLDSILVGKPVSVSSAIQKAVIEVSETGTEAAAATGLEIIPVSLIIPDVKFIANRPFLYFILANEQQLFAGIYSKPTNY